MSAIVSRLRQLQESEAAYKVVQFDRYGLCLPGSECWVPKSQVEHRSTQEGIVELTIPVWLAEAKGFDYYEKN